AAIERRIPGLDRKRVNLFAASAQKYKPTSTQLSWGETYYFVWRSENHIALPPSLLSRRLANRGTWSCTTVTLPDEADSWLEGWVKPFCGRNFSKQRRRLGIVFPIAYDFDINCRIVIPATSSLIIGTETVEDSVESASKLDFAVNDAHASEVLPDRGQQL